MRLGSGKRRLVGQTQIIPEPDNDRLLGGKNHVRKGSK